MICCCVDSKDLCKDYSCEVKETDSGITISLTSDKKEKVDAIHKIVQAGKDSCCSSDAVKGSCC